MTSAQVEIRIGVLAAVLVTAIACSSNTPGSGCTTNETCGSGQVCMDSTCLVLCGADRDCPNAQICTSGTCGAGARTIPEISDIDGDGTDRCAGATNGHACTTGTLRIAGAHLAGSTFTLIPDVGGGAAELRLVNGGSDQLAVVELDAGVSPGTYLLTATNAAGTAQQTLQLIQGEPGQPGDTGATGPVGPTGALDAAQVAAMNAAISAAQTAAASQLVTLTDAPTITVDATNADVFAVTVAGDRQFANPTGLVAGATYHILVTQDVVGGRQVTWGSAYALGTRALRRGTFVAANVGTAIGDMVSASGGALGLGEAFDGDTDEAQDEGAYEGAGSGNDTGVAGKGWGSSKKRIVRVRAYASNNIGFQNPSNGPVRLAVSGSNDGASWSTLYVGEALTDRDSLVVEITEGRGLDTTQAYSHHRLEIQSLGSNGDKRLAEVEFWEDPALLPGATTAYSFVSDGTKLYLTSENGGP